MAKLYFKDAKENLFQKPTSARLIGDFIVSKISKALEPCFRKLYVMPFE